MRANVALALAGGGPPIGHKEWTKRKPDPANVDMGAWRHELDRRIDALAAMAAGTGPAVAPEYSPPTSIVARATSHTHEGEPVMRLAIPVHLDDNGNGETGPFEGLDVDHAKFLSTSNLAIHSPNYGADGEDYWIVPVGDSDRGGKLVVQVNGDDARLAGQTVYPVVLVAD